MSRSLPAQCFACHRRFPSEQSRKAHQRTCPLHRLAKQQASQPTLPQGTSVPEAEGLPQAASADIMNAEIVRPSSKTRTTSTKEPRPARSPMGSIRTQRQRLLVIDIHDRLRALQDVCLQHAQFAVSFDRLFGQGETWKRLLMQVHDLVEGSANLLYGMLPAPTPLMLYETLRQLQPRWQSARSAMTMSAGSAVALPQEQDHENDVLMEELRAIEQVIAQVKELVAITN